MITWLVSWVIISTFFGKMLGLYVENVMFFCFKHLIFIFLIVLVWSDNIFKAKIEIFSLGKGRILAASACPSQTEGRAREGKDPSLLISTYLQLYVLNNGLLKW